MAQHYKILEKDEPTLFIKLRKTIPMINDRWTQMIEGKRTSVCGLTVMKLPSEYNDKGRAITIGPFNLEDEQWDETKDPKITNGINFQKNATLEIHFTENNDILPSEFKKFKTFDERS